MSSPAAAAAVPLPIPDLVPGLGILARLGDEYASHHRGLLAVAVCLLVLLAARTVLHAGDRVRVRVPILLLLLYVIALPVHAIVGAEGLEIDHEYVEMATTITLAFGVTGTVGIVVFDVFARRLVHMRILRDVLTVLAGGGVLFAVLHRSGVNLLSIVTTSAVLTAVIGLALQDTLGNVISGLAIQMESTLSPGDWVKINDVAGQVREVRWRSVVLITRNDDMVVMPHSVLAKAIITNSSRPVGWQRRWVHFDVHLRHAPNQVEETVLAALHDTPNVKQTDPAPDCILYGVEQDHAHYVVRYRLLDLRQDDGTDAEVRKRVWYAMRRHGIEIPYPSRNVFVTTLDAAREATKHAHELDLRRASLRQVALFAPLMDDELTHLAEGLRMELYGNGECVIREGAPGDSLYLIRRGQVVIRAEQGQGPGPRQRELSVLGPSDVLGEMSLLTGEPRQASAEARGDVECYVIDRALFQDVLARRASLVEEITQLLLARQVAIRGQVAAMGSESAARREAHGALLGRMKRFFGIDDGQKDEKEKERAQVSRDPVCGKDVDPLRARGVGIWNGRTYYFCSQDHRAVFARDPSAYKDGGGSGAASASPPSPEKRRQTPMPAPIVAAPSGRVTEGNTERIAAPPPSHAGHQAPGDVAGEEPEPETLFPRMGRMWKYGAIFIGVAALVFAIVMLLRR